MRPIEGIKVIDVTHVLAGPFAAYQLALLGADVIKVEDPHECDQSRESGSDHDLSHAKMGLGFATQASNKRAITVNLKTKKGQEIIKKLVKDADIFVENYRAGAFADDCCNAPDRGCGRTGRPHPDYARACILKYSTAPVRPPDWQQ